MNILREKEQVIIIEETPDFLLVYKPAGLAVQSRSLTETDLENYLKNQDKNRNYLAIINRIDQTVEGLVLFAKNNKAAAELSAQLNDHVIKKGYLAVVDGVPSDREMKLEDYLLRDGRTNTSAIVPKGTPNAKKAILDLKLIGTKGERSLVEIDLHTGRHHQIRVQLAGAGIPISGDRKYNKKTGGYRFPGLCSYKLEFRDPKNGKTLAFKILPKGQAFEEFMELIKK